MLQVVLIALLILISTVQSFFYKVYIDHYPGDPEATSSVYSLVSGVIVSLAAVAVALATGGLAMTFSPATLVLGTFNALVLFGYNTAFAGASQRGPYSVMMVALIAGGIIVPAVVFLLIDPVAYPISVWQWVAIGILVVSAYLVNRKSGEEKKGGVAFYVMCALVLATNGAYGSLLKYQQIRTGESENGQMVLVTYGLMTLLSFAVALFRRRRQLIRDIRRQTPVSLVFVLLASASVALAVNLMVFLYTLVDVNLLNTFDNAGVLLFSVLFSAIFFKEKLSVLNLVGVGTMCAGLVMFSLL